MLYIGDDAVLKADGIPDQEVHAGIRPEGFELREDGPLHLQMNRLEVMGRDVSIVSGHPCCQSDTIRSIIPAESNVDTASDTIRFALKPAKVFLFSKETEERIYI